MIFLSCISFIYIPSRETFLLVSCQVLELLRTKLIPEGMKSSCLFTYFNSLEFQFSISEKFSIDFRENRLFLKAVWGGNSIDAASPYSGRQSRGVRQQRGYVLIESRDSSWWLIKRWGLPLSSRSGEWASSAGISSQRRWLYRDIAFLISQGLDKNEPTPPSDLHSPLNEVIVKGSLGNINIISKLTELKRAAIINFCSFPLFLYYANNLKYHRQKKV